MTQEQKLTFSCLKSREKDEKMTLYLSRFNEPEMTSAQMDLFFLRSMKRNESDHSGETRKKVSQTTHKTAYTPWQSYENQGLSVQQSIARMLCLMHYGLQGGKHGFLKIKDDNLVGSPNIYSMVHGSTILY